MGSVLSCTCRWCPGHACTAWHRLELLTAWQDGKEPLQCNEGGWDFTLQEADTKQAAIVLEVEVGRFLDTSLIQVDVQPRLVRLLIKVRLPRKASALAVLCCVVGTWLCWLPACLPACLPSGAEPPAHHHQRGDRLCPCQGPSGCSHH